MHKLTSIRVRVPMPRKPAELDPQTALRQRLARSTPTKELRRRLRARRAEGQ